MKGAGFCLLNRALLNRGLGLLIIGTQTYSQSSMWKLSRNVHRFLVYYFRKDFD